MATYTLLQRDHLLRAACETDKIQQLKMCGYSVCGEQEAESEDDAVTLFEQRVPAEKRMGPQGTFIPPLYRKLLWFGGCCLVLWLGFLIFGLLPLAFVD